MPNRRLSKSQARTESISLPGSFFTETMARIQNVAELKVVLCAAYLIQRKQDLRHPDIIGVTYRELKAESRQLPAGLDEEKLRQALASAVEDGALLHSTLDIDGVPEDVYAMAAPMYPDYQPPAANIFTLYEQNIGIITPMIAEELKEAEKFYPPRWIEDAFKEAVMLNKRSWRYIARILERWASEGKDSGEYQGNAKKGGPSKYVKGKYGHLVKR
ncbi:MAG: DnaD domain protein [Dehalococcoidia bacterium]|nr:MAG: DnaD domain protein [Dehalococcoidia bacterium]